MSLLRNTCPACGGYGSWGRPEGMRSVLVICGICRGRGWVRPWKGLGRSILAYLFKDAYGRWIRLGWLLNALCFVWSVKCSALMYPGFVYRSVSSSRDFFSAPRWVGWGSQLYWFLERRV